MDIYIVMEDLGDGDVALRYFKTYDEAESYKEKNIDWCYYESNPRHIRVDENFKFDQV